MWCVDTVQCCLARQLVSNVAEKAPSFNLDARSRAQLFKHLWMPDLISCCLMGYFCGRKHGAQYTAVADEIMKLYTQKKRPNGKESGIACVSRR